MLIEMVSPDFAGKVYIDGDITIPDRTQVFDAEKSFIQALDTVTGASIGYIHPDLMERFSQKENGQRQHSIAYGALEMESPLRDIIREIGKVTRLRISLAALRNLIDLQPQGREGALLADGHTNVFCITSLDEGMQCIAVTWKNGGWRIMPADNADVTFRDRLFFLKP